MKTAFYVIIFFLQLLVISCNNDGSTNINQNALTPEGKFFDAQVVAVKNMDCGIPEIILIGDTTGISEILNDTIIYHSINKLIATGLSENLIVKDIKLKIQMRKPKNNEYVICTCMGTAYPQVVITSAYKIY